MKAKRRKVGDESLPEKWARSQVALISNQAAGVLGDGVDGDVDLKSQVKGRTDRIKKWVW